jgi:hypothetical protein
MRVGVQRVFLVGCLAAFCPWTVATFAQQPEGPIKVTQITGLTGVKNKTGGKLTVDGGNLHFVHEATKVDVAAASIEDVVTGADSQRIIHGTLGSIGLIAAPYGSGRFLSLFRSKLDTLTVKYRDAEGGLHGAIFALPVGKAEVIKKELLAQGAHTTAPEEAANTAGSSPAAKEQKQ